ncbi:MAG: glycosyltransferase [Ferruginibacter sp.]
MRTRSFYPAQFVSSHKNIIWITLAYLFIAACQFVLYRFILRHYGLDTMGIWSLAIAVTALGQVSNFGFSNGLVHFVPVLKKAGDTTAIQAVSGTAQASNFLLALPLLLILYYPVDTIAASLLSGDQLILFRKLLPWCLASIFINNISAVFTCLLDAAEQYAVRNMIQSGGYALLVVSGILLATQYGIEGFAWALVIQSTMVCVAMALVAKQKGLTLHLFPFSFHRQWFIKLFQYGIKFQAASLLSAFFDPLIKFFITKHFGLSTTALFEIANKVVLQVRNLLVNANQVIIPKAAVSVTTGTTATLLSTAFEKTVILAFPAAFVTLLLAPLAGYYFLGTYNPLLQLAFVWVTIGWLFNTFAAPFYFTAVGTGKLNKVLGVHAIQTGVVGLAVLYPFELPIQMAFIVPALALSAAALTLIYSFRKSPIVLHQLRIFRYAFLLFVAVATALLLYIPNSQWTTLMVASTVGMLLLGILFFLSGYFSLIRQMVVGNTPTTAVATELKPVKFSVITVCYNRAHMIEATIKSVQQQTYPHVEYIVVDGGSTDDTVAVLKKYPTVITHWISERDSGMYDAINKGLQMATGDYIHVLNSDDVYHDALVLEKLAAIIEKERLDYYHGNFCKWKDGLVKKVQLFHVGFPKYLFSTHGTFLCHPAFFISNKRNKAIGGYNLKYLYSSDYDYVLRTIKEDGVKGIHVDIEITDFRLHDASITSTGIMRTEKQRILQSHGYYQYSWIKRTAWYYILWIYYKWLNVFHFYRSK